MNKVLVLVVTYNSMEWAERCFKSLEESSVPVDVIAIDNASKDGTANYIEMTFPKVEIYRSEENIGFGAANNIGLRIAIEKGYEYVYLLNADAWLEKDTLERIIARFKTKKGLGLVSPMQCQRDLMTPDEQFEKHQPEFFPAAHWMLKLDCVRKVGGFSPVFPHYGEDLDYFNRIKYFGFGAEVEMGAKAVHDRSDRPRPKEFRMRLKYFTAKAAICNPSANPFKELRKQFAILLLMAVKNCSWDLVEYSFRLFKDYPELKEKRNASQKEGAYL